MVLIDTNVLLDIVSENPDWSEWSFRSLIAAGARDALVVNEVVYAEMSVGYDSIEDLDEFLGSFTIGLARIPERGLFLAGRVYRQYRRASGTKTGVLPDFFIGAHAAVTGAPLLTRDTRRIRSYFPTVALIAPDSD
jgi:predicted nucleic acid-binding protein